MQDFLDELKAFSIALLLVAFTTAVGYFMCIGEGWNG